MDVNRLVKVYKAVRRLYLYNNANMVLNAEEIAEALNGGDPKDDVLPSDVMAALGYGMICEDRFDFDIRIRYRGPGSRKFPMATFTFAGRPVTLKQLKQISKFENGFGQIKFQQEGNPEENPWSWTI